MNSRIKPHRALLLALILAVAACSEPDGSTDGAGTDAGSTASDAGATADTNALPTDSSATGGGVDTGSSSGGGSPGNWQDPLVYLTRVKTSSFLETLETRVRADGLALACTGVRGLVVTDMNDPAQPKVVHQLKPKLTPQYGRCQHVAWNDNTWFATNHGDILTQSAFIAAFDAKSGKEVATYTEKGRVFEGIVADGKVVWTALHGDGVMALEHLGSSFKKRGNVASLPNAWGVALSGKAESDGHKTLHVAAAGGSYYAIRADPAIRTAASTTRGRAPRAGARRPTR